VSCTNNYHNNPVAGGSAYLLIACAHCRFDGNALNAHYGSHAEAADPIARECGTDGAALLAVGSDRRLSLARHISARGNDGFCYRATDAAGGKGRGLALTNAGLLQVLPPLVTPANIQWTTITVATSRPETLDWNTFDLQGGPRLWGFGEEPAPPALLCALDPQSPACGEWPVEGACWPTSKGCALAAGAPAVRRLDHRDWLGGAPTWEASCADECVLPLGRRRLSLSPTIAGQAVYVAVQLRVAYANSHAYNGMCVAVLLQIHDGVAWQSSANNTYTAIPGSAAAVDNGDWRVHTFMAAVHWNSTSDEALFQLRFGGGQRVNQTANATIQIGRVTIAPVGHPAP
jgi:hypothetical protein